MTPSGIDSAAGSDSALPRTSSLPRTAGTGRGMAIVAGIALAAIGSAVYANSLSVPFLFDDATLISDSRGIERLWPPWHLLASSFRPVLKLSLAVSYALGERDPFGYHLFNCVVHVLCAMTLFGVVRRTLILTDRSRCVLGGATGTAFAVALLWLVHPLQTQAVTYTIQRGESMASLFYLFTLYAAIRASMTSVHVKGFSLVAITSCALGMGTKEIVATAPLAVLLYDRTFIAGSLAAALQRRRWLYVGLVACWGIAIATVGRDIAMEHGTGGVLGDDLVSPWIYLCSQPAILIHYLGLAVWPDPLIFDYDWRPVAGLREALVPGLAVLTLLGIAGVGLWRGRWWGFVGSWFFLVLAPTSSFVPLEDLAVEHRMYLPLAAPLLLAVLGASWGLQRLSAPRGVAVFALAAVALLLADQTISRNADYQDPTVLWAGVVRHRPDNYRGALNLGFALEAQGRGEEARRSFEHAIELRPGDPRAHFNLGNGSMSEGRFDEAISHYRIALVREPHWPSLLGNYGVALRRSERTGEAVRINRRAVELSPKSARARQQLGMALEAAGETSAAEEMYRSAIALDPTHAPSRLSLGMRLAVENQPDSALIQLRAARDLDPGLAGVEKHLANVLLGQGRATEAIPHYRAALDRDPGSASAYNGLAWILATHPDPTVRRPVEAIALATSAVELTSGRAATALDTLAAAQAAAGDFEAASITARRALELAESAHDADFVADVAQRLAGYQRAEIYVDSGSE